MKRTDGFLLKYIEGVPYLLPYGQRIVEHRRNLRLNETSAYLWEILPECASPHELHEKIPEKRKICQSLGIMGGFLLAVMLW